MKPIYCLLLTTGLLGACASKAPAPYTHNTGSTPVAEAAQDLGTVLSRFESLRQEMQLPFVRLSLEPNPFVAAAKGIGSMVMDEPFAYSLSDPALTFVLVHEFTHLKHQDPRKGMELLRKLHAAQGASDAPSDFMYLWGKYSNAPEFQNMLKEVEGRADEHAVRYLHQHQQNGCAAGKELELKTGRSFGDRIVAMCQVAFVLGPGTENTDQQADAPAEPDELNEPFSFALSKPRQEEDVEGL